MARTIRDVTPKLTKKPVRERVAAYARVSLEKDTMMHSLSAQISNYSELIQSTPGWEYAGVYADGAYTGTKAARPEFRRLLEDCRAGKIDRIITKSVSRFARNTLTLLETTRELGELGIDIFFEEENVHSSSGEGEMLLSMMAAFAQEESRSVSENVRWMIRKRFEKGEPVNWRQLFGYRISKGHIEVYEPEAIVVRMVFDAYTRGTPVARITRQLNAQGIRALRGAEWTIQKVNAMLGNEKYAGNSLLQKYFIEDHLTKLEKINHGECPKYYAEGTHPAIIDAETWERACAIMEEHRRASGITFGPRKKNTYPFTDRIICGKCGKPFHRKILREKIAWNCYTFLYKGKAACPAKLIPEDVLTALSAEVMGMTEFDPDAFRSTIREIRVPEANRLVFLFHDGREEERTWHHRSRADAWTPEMRIAAAEAARKGHAT